MKRIQIPHNRWMELGKKRQKMERAQRYAESLSHLYTVQF